jgi:hypothetical protein
MKPQQPVSDEKIEVRRSQYRSRGHRRGELSSRQHGANRGERSGNDLKSN